MYRFEAPVDWHVGEVTEVKGKGKVKGNACKHGQVEVVYQSKTHGQDSQYHELQVERYGVQQQWVVLEPEGATVTDRAAS
jgi:hypothetical protein